MDETTFEDPVQIKASTVNYFEKSFKKDQPSRSSLGGDFKRNVSANQAAMLEKLFDKKEVEAAIKECHSLKSPGPDGFNFSFVKKGWRFILKDVYAEFRSTAAMAKGINCTFVSLIPKIEGASTFNE